MRRQHHPRKGIQRANRWLAVAPVDENCSQINSFNLLAVGNPYGKARAGPENQNRWRCNHAECVAKLLRNRVLLPIYESGAYGARTLRNLAGTR